MTTSLPTKNPGEPHDVWVRRAWAAVDRDTLLDAMAVAFGDRADDLDVDSLSLPEMNEVLMAYSLA